MDETHGQRVEELFQAAVEVPEADRARFLRKQCGDDTRLREEVESLLACDEPEDGFLRTAALIQKIRASSLYLKTAVGMILRFVSPGTHILE